MITSIFIQLFRQRWVAFRVEFCDKDKVEKMTPKSVFLNILISRNTPYWRFYVILMA